MEHETKIYPIDVTELQMGDVIDCTQLINVHPSLREYSLKLLSLKGNIETKLRRENINLHLRIDGNNLRVMTDAELAEHAAKEALAGFQRLRRNVVRLGDVDAEQLTDGQREAHLNRFARIGRIAQAAEQASRRRAIVAPVPATSQLPKMAEA
jgi:hypothetical protein